MKYKILIMPKNNILDPQGSTIEKNLKNLGFNKVSNIRQGKVIELDISDDVKDPILYIEEVCSKLLVNNIIEEFEII